MGFLFQRRAPPPQNPTRAFSRAARVTRAEPVIHITQNEPVSFDWTLRSSSGHDSLRQDDVAFVQEQCRQAFMEEQARRSGAMFQPAPRSSLMDRVHRSSFDFEDAARAAAPENHTLTKKELKRMQKQAARTLRTEQKKQRKVAKLAQKHAKTMAKHSGNNAIASYSHEMDGIASSLQTADASRAGSEKKPERMEFLFFSGSAEDSDMRDLDMQHRRVECAMRAGIPLSSPASKIVIKPTLVRNMPRPFEPTLDTFM